MAHSNSQDVEEHTKKYSNITELFNASKAMSEFQRIHNLIREDYLVLLNILEDEKSDPVKFNALYRASLKSLFTIIEADIFGLNNLDQYPGYSDNHRFEDKFKKTYTQICTTWNKQEIKKQYFDTKYSKLKALRKKRDELIHPKETDHIHGANASNFEELKTVFSDYDYFINSIMDNFFIGVELNFSDLLR